MAYDVSEHSKDGQQIKYLGRLYLELARKHPRLSWTKKGMSIRPMYAKTLAYPEVRTLQSVCFLSFPMFQSSITLEANPLTKCSLMTTHWTAFTDQAQLL